MLNDVPAAIEYAFLVLVWGRRPCNGFLTAHNNPLSPPPPTLSTCPLCVWGGGGVGACGRPAGARCVRVCGCACARVPTGRSPARRRRGRSPWATSADRFARLLARRLACGEEPLAGRLREEALCAAREEVDRRDHGPGAGPRTGVLGQGGRGLFVGAGARAFRGVKAWWALSRPLRGVV